MIPAKAKYSARKPKIAKTFDVKMINVSLEIASIAGIESTAKIKSVNSITNNTIKRGVATVRAFIFTKNLLPCISSVTGKNFLNMMTNGFLFGLSFSSL